MGRSIRFVLSGRPHTNGAVDPPAVYYTVELHNTAADEARIATYAFCQLRGDTTHDIAAAFDKRLGALLAWNRSNPDLVRVFGCSEQPASYETTADYARGVGGSWPGVLSDTTAAADQETLGVLHLSHTLAPDERISFSFLLTFSSEGRRGATATYRA